MASKKTPDKKAEDAKKAKAEEAKTENVKVEDQAPAPAAAATEKTEAQLRAEIRAEIEAEYAEEAKKKAAGAAATEKNDDPNRRVRIKLFKDNGKYKDPLFVSVGKYRAAIPRGIEVDVPYYVAVHIEEVLHQDEQTAELITMMTGKYEKDKDALE